jgi:hypothetical protein
LAAASSRSAADPQHLLRGEKTGASGGRPCRMPARFMLRLRFVLRVEGHDADLVRDAVGVRPTVGVNPWWAMG